MIKCMRLLRFFMLAGVIFLISGGVVSAQASDKTKAITIEPFLQEVILEPSDASKSFSVMVTNNTPSKFSFNLTPVDFGTLNETGGIFFTGTESIKLSSKYGLANWIEIEQKNMVLEPGQKAQINVTFFNRTDLAPGGHYGAIFINSVNSQSGAGANVSLRQSISSLVLAVKRGGEKYDLGLDSINTNATWFKAPTSANLRFKNNGNTHTVPRGIVHVIGKKNAIFAKGVINEDSSYILPETYRQIPVELKNQMSYPLQLVRSHTVEVNYRYDGLDKFATKTYTIRWINWPFLAAILVILIAVIAFIYIKYPKSLNFKGLKR